MAAHLAARHRVGTYARRGYAPSTLENPDEEQMVERHSADATRLIDIFGSSGGAVSGLELVARHPDLGRTLAAHEPPAGYLLLPDVPRPGAALWDTYQREGAVAALRGFAAALGAGEGATAAPARNVARADLFVRHDRLAFRR